MSRYIARRLGHLLLVLLGASTLSFVLLFLAGDPTHLLLPLDAGPELRAAFRKEYGFDQPFHVQYGRFLVRLAQGDLGRSLRHRQGALDLVIERAPATLQLAGAGILFAIIIALPAGILAAVTRGTFTEAGVMVMALLGQSIPVFWLGLALIIIFGVELRWLPISGTGTLAHLIMPTIAVGTFTAASIARLTRSSILEQLGQDYTRTARSKGVGERRVLWRHILRNAAIPVVTIIGLQLGQLLSGALITETIFAWPGIGRLVFNAVLQGDYPVVQATVIAFAVIFGLVNLLVDLTYAMLDPRIRYG
jgi:peptide/nickel transport system permease protein